MEILDGVYPLAYQSSGEGVEVRADELDWDLTLVVLPPSSSALPEPPSKPVSGAGIA